MMLQSYFLSTHNVFSASKVSKLNITDIESTIISELASINPMLKKAIENSNCKKPILKLFEHGTSPILEESVFRKAKFVYNLDPSTN